MWAEVAPPATCSGRGGPPTHCWRDWGCGAGHAHMPLLGTFCVTGHPARHSNEWQEGWRQPGAGGDPGTAGTQLGGGPVRIPPGSPQAGVAEGDMEDASGEWQGASAGGPQDTREGLCQGSPGSCQVSATATAWGPAHALQKYVPSWESKQRASAMRLRTQQSQTRAVGAPSSPCPSGIRRGSAQEQEHVQCHVYTLGGSPSFHEI